MFNLKLFIISLISPFVIGVIGGFTGFGIVIVYLEHLYLANILGIKATAGDGGFVPMPVAPEVFIATLILDYVILVFLIYILLFIVTKSFYQDKDI